MKKQQYLLNGKEFKNPLTPFVKYVNGIPFVFGKTEQNQYFAFKAINETKTALIDVTNYFTFLELVKDKKQKELTK